MESNTNYTKSVTGVVIKDGKVLLARHTYGAGKNMLVVPGGCADFRRIRLRSVCESAGIGGKCIQ